MYPNPTKTQVDKFEKSSEYSKYEIQKDTKIQTEIIRHSNVIDGKVMPGRAVKGGKGECLRTFVLNRVELSLHNKGHPYICNKRPEAKGSGRKLGSGTSISANAMSFNR